MKIFFFLHIFSKRGKKDSFSPENAEQRKALLTVVGLVEIISTHYSKIKHRFIVIKTHILINKPISMILTHRFL